MDCGAKRVGTRFLGVVIALAMAGCFALSAQVAPAQAAEIGTLASGSASLTAQAKPSLIVQTMWAGQPQFEGLNIANFPSGAKVTKVVSSNTSIVKVTKESGVQYGYLLSPGKAGSSKVTVTYSVNGKSSSISGTYKVKAFPTPFKSIKVNGKSVNVPSSKNKRMDCPVTGFTGTKATVQFSLSSGWKMSYLHGSTYTSGKNDWKSVAVENGKAFSVPKGKEANVTATVRNTAGDTFHYSIQLARSGGVSLMPATLWVGDSTYLRVSSTVGVDPMLSTAVKITSSNTAVLKVKKYGTTIGSISLLPRKAGKSKVTLTYKVGGKTYTTSAFYTVKAYPNPFKSLQLNGASVKLSSHKFLYSVGSYKKATAKVKFTPSSGWSLQSIQCYVGKNGSGNSKQIKNGASVSIPAKGYCSITAFVVNKSGDTFQYNVFLNRA